MFVTSEEFNLLWCAAISILFGVYVGYLMFGREFTFLGYYFKRENTFVKAEDPMEPQINSKGKWDWPEAIYSDGATLEKEYYARPDNKDAPKIKRNII